MAHLSFSSIDLQQDVSPGAEGGEGSQRHGYCNSGGSEVQVLQKSLAEVLWALVRPAWVAVRDYRPAQLYLSFLHAFLQPQLFAATGPDDFR